VGDRLYTDIKMGYDLGVQSILVLSGESTRQMHDEGEVKADHIVDSVKNIFK
ncbi:MAG TPA: hypothetical protein DHN33_01600, partial [Eubacteriaceae bacterium]|nr:hypothetical protein [Eubacteriaceae bacterium]